MIEINIDNDLISNIKLCITQQNQNIELQYSHLVKQDYKSFVSQFNFQESSFQYFYKLLVSNILKKYIDSERAVYSSAPDPICYFPSLLYYNCISHPLCKNCHSVFLPLTQWTESSTISVKYEHKSISIGHTTNTCYIIADFENIIIPENYNVSNNTYFGLFFYIMSYQNYKSSMVYSSKNIGGFFSLL